MPSGLKARSKSSDAMEFRKRLWLLYLSFICLEIAPTMFVAYVQHQSGNNASGVELLHVLEICTNKWLWGQKRTQDFERGGGGGGAGIS